METNNIKTLEIELSMWAALGNLHCERALYLRSKLRELREIELQNQLIQIKWKH